MFKKLAKVVRATSTRIKPDKAVYWLGNKAKAELLSGAKLGLHEKWSLRQATSSLDPEERHASHGQG